MTSDEIRTVILEVLNPGHFYLEPAGKLRVEYSPKERVPWEVFCGRLLDSSQTRAEKTFESWNVSVEHPESPLSGPVLSVKFDPAGQQLYVTRSILIYAWEPHQAEENVIVSRQTQKWTGELVGTIDLSREPEAAPLHRHLSHYVFQAVVGTSRLPITSLESPLPAFSLGQLAYFPGRSAPPDARPLSGPAELIERRLSRDLTPLQRAKLLETALRAAAKGELPELCDSLLGRCREARNSMIEIPELVKTIFNHVALSPYTGFVDNLVGMLLRLAEPHLLGRSQVIDTFSYLLRHLVRHLTAFDLRTFHNLGANYPDALALDALLKAYVHLIDDGPEEFEGQPGDWKARRTKRLRRRALRQAWLIRRQYEGYRVPDAPTSPGENQRVLPEPFVRVPQEQIMQPGKRRKQLFAGDANRELLAGSVQRILTESIDDLENPRERRELGVAVYLDRPLGIFKRQGEIDRTPLLSYEAFSPQIAASRLINLVQWGLVDRDQRERWAQSLCGKTPGFPVSNLDGTGRPGVVALEDARQAAADFVFLRTTGVSLPEFLSQYEFGRLSDVAPELLQWLLSAERVLLIRTSSPAPEAPRQALLTGFDEQMQPRIELGLGQRQGSPVRYRDAGGVEYLEEGLRVLRVWVGDSHGTWAERDLGGDDVRLPAKFGF